MTLQAQEIEIPLNLGMATKPSSELQEPTHMRLVQNLHWRGLGELEKRPTDDVSHTIAEPSSSVYDEDLACGLALRGTDPVVVTGRHGVMTYSETTAAAQFARGEYSSSSTPGPILQYCPVSYDVTRQFVERTQWAKNDRGIYQVASAQYNGIHVIAWIAMGSTSIKLRCKAIEAFTGKVLATVEYVDITTTAGYMVQACEYTESGKEGVLIAYVDDASSPYTVSTLRYDAASNQFVADSNLSTDVSETFTIVKNGNRVYFAYNKQSTGFLTVEDRTIGSISSTHTANHSAIGIDVVVGPTRTLIASCTTSTAYAEVFGSPSDVITAISASSETFYKVTAALETRSATTHDAVLWATSVTSGSPASTRCRSREVNFANTTPVNGGIDILPHCQTIANAFTLRGHAHVILAVYTKVNGTDITEATSCFVARYRTIGGGGASRHDAVAKLAHDRFFVTAHLSFDPAALGLAKQGNSVYVDSSNNAWLALTADPSSIKAHAGYIYPQTIFLTRLSAARPMPMPHCQPEPGVVFSAGALPWVFDGSSPSEATPLVPPKLVFDVSAGTGQTGTFSAIPVYRWVDRAGREHRLAGTAVSTTITNKQIDVYISVCPMAAYDGVRLPLMEPELYITTSGGSVRYLAADASGNKLYYSSVTSDEIWYKYTAVVPANVSAQTLAIFTTETAPEPTPGFAHVSTIVDRVWAVDMEDRSRIWYSKPLVAGFGVEWATVNTIYVGDEAVAVVDVGGTPTILARGGIYQIAGPGPDANGSGTFSPPVRLPFEVECVDPVSVCRTPLGIVFRGRRGLYVLADSPRAEPALLIDPTMLTDPALDPSSTTSYRLRVVYQEQTNEIVAITPAGDRLVYNIVEQKWSKHTQTTALVTTTTSDLVVARGKLWRLDRVSGTSDGLRSEKLYSEDSESYNSDTTGWEIDTPWYRLDGAAGMVRLWRVWFAFRLPDLTADITDISAITVRYYVNNDDTSVQSVTWTGAEIDDYYNALATERVVRLPFAPRVQLIHSFRFVIECTLSGASSGPEPLAMRLQFGVRPTMRGKRNPVTVK